MSNISIKTAKISKIGILAAISVILVFLVHIPIFPAVSFLEYDPADVPVMLGTFAMGPGAGIILCALACIIQGLTVSAASSWYGIVMHFLASGTYVLVAGFIYKRRKTKKDAILSLVFGTLAWTLIMVPANLILTPVYLQMVGVPAEAALPTVKSLLGWIVLFNLVKAGINSTITFVLYKRVSIMLH